MHYLMLLEKSNLIT